MWIVLAAAAIVVTGAALPLLRGRSRRRELAAALSRARAEHSRLGSFVETVHGGDDEWASSLLRSAEERWHTTGSLLASARSVEEVAVAEETATEGTALVREACRRLGVTPPGR